MKSWRWRMTWSWSWKMPGLMRNRSSSTMTLLLSKNSTRKYRFGTTWKRISPIWLTPQGTPAWRMLWALLRSNSNRTAQSPWALSSRYGKRMRKSVNLWKLTGTKSMPLSGRFSRKPRRRWCGRKIGPWRLRFSCSVLERSLEQSWSFSS